MEVLATRSWVRPQNPQYRYPKAAAAMGSYGAAAKVNVDGFIFVNEFEAAGDVS